MFIGQRATPIRLVLALAQQPLRRGRPVPGGKDRPLRAAAKGGAPGPSTCEAVCLREATQYATRGVSASEAIQISANRCECECFKLGRNACKFCSPLAVNGSKRTADLARARIHKSKVGS